MEKRVFECQECHQVWEAPSCAEGGKHGYEIECPKCGSLKKIKRMSNGERHVCGGAHHDHEHAHGHGCCGGHH